MFTLVSDAEINRLPLPQMIWVGPSFGNFDFEFSLHDPIGIDPSGQWRTLPAKIFTVPNSGIQYYLPAASGAFVYTAEAEGSDEVRNAMAALRDVVAIIREGRTLPANAELENLLTQALPSQRAAPENVEEWARRLAESVGVLTD